MIIKGVGQNMKTQLSEKSKYCDRVTACSIYRDRSVSHYRCGINFLGNIVFFEFRLSKRLFIDRFVVLVGLIALLSYGDNNYSLTRIY